MKSYAYNTSLSHEDLKKIEEVIKISRALSQTIEEDVAQLNKNIVTTGQTWKSGRDARGPYLETVFKFKTEKDALDAVLKLSDLQERCDHHAHFVLENFTQLKIELCTHQPQWGVSHLDFAFADVMTQIILK